MANYPYLSRQRFGKIETIAVNTYPIEIISVAEAKTQLRVDHDEDDQYIETLILAATNTINRFTNRIINSSKIKYSTYINQQPGIRLPYEASTVDSVKNITIDASTSGIDFKIYEFDADDTYIDFVTTTTGDFEIIFDTGFTAANIPAVFKEAIYLLVDNWYEIRELVQTRGPEKIPLMLDILLDTYRRISI